MRRWALSALVIVLVVFGYTPTIPTRAQTVPIVSAPAPYTGLDLLMIIDQSGSMGGTRYNGDRIYGDGNDPLDLRFVGPQQAIQWLSSFDRRTIYSTPPNNQFAYLTFGSTTRQLMDWTPIDTQRADWGLVEAQIIQDISSDRFGNINLGYTDFERAFRDARGIIENAPLSTPNERRLSVVILLTDGAPCVPTPDVPLPPCDNLAEVGAAAHLTRLRSQIAANLPNTLVYAMIMDASNAYFLQLQNEWEQIVCANANPCSSLALTQITTNAQLLQSFHLILADLMTEVSGSGQTQPLLLQPTGVPGEFIGTFYVPPYSQYLRVNLFKPDSSPLNTVELIRPDGTPETFVNPEGLNEPVQLHEVDLPVPGDWQVRIQNIDPSQFQMLGATDIIRAGAVIAQTPSTGTMYLPLSIGASIVDGNNLVLPTYPDPALALTVDLDFYDATYTLVANRPLVFSQSMALDPNFPTTNRFITDFRPLLPGTYEIRLSASFTDPRSQQQVFILEDVSLLDSLLIDEAYLYWSGLSTNSQRADADTVARVDLRLKGSDQPLDASDLVLQMELFDQQGASLISPAILANTGTDVGSVMGVIAIATPGNYTVRTKVGYQDAQGVFFELDPNSTVDEAEFPLEIRPVSSLNLAFTLPSELRSDVQSPFPQFWQNTPVTIRAELKDSAGTLVSVAAVTNGLESLPALTLTRDGQPVPNAPVFTEVRAGVYEARLDSLEAGTYQLQAAIGSTNNDLVGDYTLGTTQPTLMHIRQNAAWIIPLFAGSIAAVLAVVGGIALFIVVQRRRIQSRRENAMTGKLVLSEGNDDGSYMPIRTLNLNDYRMNRIKFKRNDLIKPFEYMLVTNGGTKAASQQGAIFVSEFEVGNELIKPNLVLFPSNIALLYQTERGGEIVSYYVGYEKASVSGA